MKTLLAIGLLCATFYSQSSFAQTDTSRRNRNPMDTNWRSKNPRDTNMRNPGDTNWPRGSRDSNWRKNPRDTAWRNQPMNPRDSSWKGKKRDTLDRGSLNNNSFPTRGHAYKEESNSHNNSSYMTGSTTFYLRNDQKQEDGRESEEVC